MKNTVSEIKISLDEITSKLYSAGKQKKKQNKNSEFEGKATKASQKEE